MGATRIARFPMEIVICDVMKQDSLDAALAGVDIVVHCARAKGNDNSVTTNGTQLLLDRARAAGIKQLIFTSSVAVYGDAAGLVHEDTRPAALSVYGAGKRDAEEACRAAASEAMRVSVIRPTLVYGPFSDLWTMPYLTRFASGRWRHLGPKGEGKCNLVYVGDLVRFVEFLASNDAGAIRRVQCQRTGGADLELLPRAVQRGTRLSRPATSRCTAWDEGRASGGRSGSPVSMSWPITRTCC